MKKLVIVSCFVASALITRAEVFPFDISPLGVSPAEGLSPSNHLHEVVNSQGSGNEVLSGINYDTETMILDLSFGYGSIAGFTDLSGPVTVVQIQGPADQSSVFGDVRPVSLSPLIYRNKCSSLLFV